MMLRRKILLLRKNRTQSVPSRDNPLWRRRLHRTTTRAHRRPRSGTPATRTPALQISAVDRSTRQWWIARAATSRRREARQQRRHLQHLRLHRKQRARVGCVVDCFWLFWRWSCVLFLSCITTWSTMMLNFWRPRHLLLYHLLHLHLLQLTHRNHRPLEGEKCCGLVHLTIFFVYGAVCFDGSDSFDNEKNRI